MQCSDRAFFWLKHHVLLECKAIALLDSYVEQLARPCPVCTLVFAATFEGQAMKKDLDMAVSRSS